VNSAAVGGLGTVWGKVAETLKIKASPFIFNGYFDFALPALQ